jgi:2-methylisocitrate lyase-like PEP mutase family enzyme
MTSFRALHRPGEPLLMPNAWDVGSARILASLGFPALATTSSGFAATLGRADYSVTREEAVAHGRAVAEAVDVPVSADLEDGFGDDPADVAETVAQARAAGLAGCSIEDATGRDDLPIHPLDRAVERVRAAVEAKGDLVLTARAENHLHGRDDLGDTIARLQAFAEAGSDVLYAPGLRRAEDIGAVVEAVAPRPVNVLAVPGATGRIRLLQADVAALETPPVFSTVLALGATHLFGDVAELRDKLAAHLAPAGRLHLSGLVAETSRGRRYLDVLHRAGEVAPPLGAEALHAALGRPEDFRVSGCMAYAVIAEQRP